MYIQKTRSWWAQKKLNIASTALRDDPQTSGTLAGIGYGLLWLVILFADGLIRAAGGA